MRLGFLKFILRNGDLWLCDPWATKIWKCLAGNSNTAEERKVCFEWFEEIMGEESGRDPDPNCLCCCSVDLDPNCLRTFFDNTLLKLNPDLITESFKRCTLRCEWISLYYLINPSYSLFDLHSFRFFEIFRRALGKQLSKDESSKRLLHVLRIITDQDYQQQVHSKQPHK